MTQEDMHGRRFEPAGRCIFCGSDGGAQRLRDEHIMPYSLGGTAVLPKASCAECEKITSYLDGYLSRQIFYDCRLAAGIQSRTPKSRRPKTRPFLVSRQGKEELREFPVGDHPFVTMLPVLGHPGILTGRLPGAPFSSDRAFAYYYYPPGYTDQYDLPSIEQLQRTFKRGANLDVYARALAEIGYCHGVATGHIEANAALPVAECILGKNGFASYLVGSDPTEPGIPDEQPILHRVRTVINHRRDADIYAAEIRLFAHMAAPDDGVERGMPTYFVALKREVRPTP